MSSLLKLKVVPALSMTQKEAAEALGGLPALRALEEQHGLVPWEDERTMRRFRVSAIEEALKRAEDAIRNRRAARPAPKPAQSAAAE